MKVKVKSNQDWFFNLLLNIWLNYRFWKVEIGEEDEQQISELLNKEIQVFINWYK